MPRRLRSPRAVGIAAAVTCASLLFALPRASVATHGATEIVWEARGAFSGLQFTSIVSPAGFPCIVAFTALQNGGLRVSTDCGVQYADLLFTDAYEVTAKNENVGYVAAGPTGMLKTLDQGGDWFSINDGLPPLRDARSVVIHQDDLDSLTVGLRGGGVYVGGPAQDSLVQWTPIHDGLGDWSVRHLARTRAGTFLLAATDGGMWRRESGVWSLVGAGIVGNRVLIDPADSNRVYVAAEDGLYKSVNGGWSFFLSSSGLPAGVAVNDVARQTDLARVLFVGLRGAGVYQSRDFGATWTVFGPPVPGDGDVRAVLATAEPNDNLGHVFAGTRSDGLYEVVYHLDDTTPAEPTTWGRIKARYRGSPSN